MAKEFISGGTRKNAWSIDPTVLIVIGVDTPDGPEHPLFDARALESLDEAMTANIAMLGVLEPVLVDKDEEGRIVVVDGRRRVLHARAANKALAAQGEPTIEIPVYADSVRRGGREADQARWGLVMVSANEIRREDSVLNRATKAQSMAGRGVSKDQIARAFGVTPGQIDRWLVLAAAPESIRSKVQAGEISATVAVAIAMKAPAQRRRAIEDAVAIKKIKGKAPSQRDLDKAEGKAQPPTKKVLREVSKRADELFAKSSSLYLRGARDALKFALEGGEFLVSNEFEQSAKASTSNKVAPTTPVGLEVLRDVIIQHGLTNKATKVYDAMEPSVDTIARRLEAAGFHVDARDLSKACLALLKAGQIERSIGGYRLLQNAPAQETGI